MRLRGALNGVSLRTDQNNGLPAVEIGRKSFGEGTGFRSQPHDNARFTSGAIPKGNTA